MKPNENYIGIRDRWWALPLVLPSLSLPVLNTVTTYVHISTGTVILFYLPLALMISLTFFFGWAASLGIIISTIWYRYPQVGLFETFSTISHLVVTVAFSRGGYRVFSPQRNNVPHGDPHLLFQRMLWQVFCPATLFLILFQFAAFVGVYESEPGMTDVILFSIDTSIGYQPILAGDLVNVPLCYFIIQTVRNPLHLRGYFSQLKQQSDTKMTKTEFAVWLIVLTILVAMLCMPLNKQSSIFSANYALSLLLSVMLWEAMRYGYKFISLIRTVIPTAAIHYYRHYIPWYSGYDTRLTIISSSCLVFSLTVNFIAILTTRQRSVTQRNRRLAFFDSIVRISSLRVLNRDLGNSP